MGEGYKAEDLKLGRYVAIKVLPASATRDQTTRQRFLREARSASALNHPHIVTIYAIEQAEAGAFIVMEYLEGASLRQTVRREPLALQQAFELGAQIAEA